MLLAGRANELGHKTRKRVGKAMLELLAPEVARRLAPSFGSCPTCRFWRAGVRPQEQGGPHLCMLFDAALSEAETRQICIAHDPAG